MRSVSKEKEVTEVLGLRIFSHLAKGETAREEYNQ